MMTTMTKEMMNTMMAEKYHMNAYTGNYIFGWFEKGLVLMATVEDIKALERFTKLDTSSRGAGYSLRFKPSRSQKEMLKFYNLEVLCSKEYFEEVYKNCKYNRGEVFEKLVTEKFNQVWEKDNVPFWKDGDITVNGKSYQIKFEKATFTTEKQLAKLSK